MQKSEISKRPLCSWASSTCIVWCINASWSN